MKRFKTKQEYTKIFSKNSFNAQIITTNRLWGLPVKYGEEITNDSNYSVTDEFTTTTDPHPFDSMDIKVRVTPKQSKKLQKKAFKMGYKWHSNTPNGDKQINYTDDGYTHLRFRGSIISAISCDYEDMTELTYKQFMNGTVPKKKEFKVGDWVEVVRDKGFMINGGSAVGMNAKVVSLNGKEEDKGDDVVVIHYGHVANQRLSYSAKDLKHTTKPKEQPLMFKQWDVDVRETTVKIGCKTFDKNDLESALLVMNTVNEHSDVNAFRTWLDTNSAKLGL